MAVETNFREPPLLGLLKLQVEETVEELGVGDLWEVVDEEWESRSGSCTEERAVEGKCHFGSGSKDVGTGVSLLAQKLAFLNPEDCHYTGMLPLKQPVAAHAGCWQEAR